MSQECEVENSIEIDIAQICRTEEGNLVICFKETYLVDIKDIKQIQAALRELGRGQKSKVLVIAGQNGSISKEAREMDMFDGEKNKTVLAVAIVTRQLHQILLGTLYYKFRRQNYPYQLFRKVENAKKWLAKID